MSPLRLALYVSTALAVAVPLCVAYQLPPQPAFVSQALSVLLWCVVLAVLAMLPASSNARSIAQWSSLALWVLIGAGMAMSVLTQRSPLFVVLPAGSVVLVAGLIAGLAPRVPVQWVGGWFAACALGLLFAAALNSAVVVLQSFAPHWYDDLWIAGRADDRAFGNLRQPNLLATLTLWGMLAAGLFASSARWIFGVTVLVLTAVLIATGSRSGWLGLPIALVAIMLATMLGRSIRRRWLVMALAACAAAMAVALVSVMWITLMREGSLDSTSQRLSLWRDVLTLIAHEPWFGVGFGQLNFVWTLTPFPARTPNVFDHAHSLPLQLAVELGLPLTVLILAVALYSLFANRFNQHSALGSRRWLALGMLAVVLVHSLFEYPLWFAHFLLPTALVLALLVMPLSPVPKPAASARRSFARWPALVAVLGGCGVAWAVQGYLQVVAVYRSASEPITAARLAAVAQGHALYGFYGDYAAVMLAGDNAVAKDFPRPARAIIDERFLVAWSRSFVRENNPQAAAFLVARAREFPAHPLFGSLPPISFEPTPSASTPLGPQSFR